MRPCEWPGWKGNRHSTRLGSSKEKEMKLSNRIEFLKGNAALILVLGLSATILLGGFEEQSLAGGPDFDALDVSGNVTIGGTLDVTGGTTLSGVVDLNGLADGLVLDAGGDESISAPTDAQIDIE